MLWAESVSRCVVPASSDNERTKLEAGTTHLLTIINGYSGKEGLQEAADYMLELLKEFAASKDEELIYF